MKKTFLLLWCLISIGLQAVEAPPELVQRFFKRFTHQLGLSPVWSFTTSKIDTDWGHCIINDDEVIVTIGTQTAHWLVPGGPWTIEYTTGTETVAVVPQRSITLDDDTCEKLCNKADTICIDAEPLSKLPEPWLGIPLPTIKRSTSTYVKRAREEAVVDDVFAALHINLDVDAEVNEALRCNQALDHVKILDTLERKIEYSMHYNQERLLQRYDYNALGVSGGSLVVALGLGYLLLREIDKEHEFFNQQFKERVAQLNSMGIAVSEEKRPFSRDIIIHPTSFLSPERWNEAHRIGNELVQIRDKQFNKQESFTFKEMGMTLGLLGVLASLKASWDFFIMGLFPHYKKQFSRYETMLKAFRDYRQRTQ